MLGGMDNCVVNDVVVVDNDTCTECKIWVKVCPMRVPYVGEYLDIAHDMSFVTIFDVNQQ